VCLQLGQLSPARHRVPHLHLLLLRVLVLNPCLLLLLLLLFWGLLLW
jgi:hypothetical protein